MSVILDHTQDLSGTETHRLINLHEPPAFVKAASHERLHGNPETLPPQCYGDATQRLFPCHSAPATWMSSLFFFDKQAELSPAQAQRVEARLRETAIYFNILPQVEELKTKIAQDAKHELGGVPDADFALVWVDDDKQKSRHYPIRNAAEVKVAADWFTKYRDEFVFADRQCIAKKIMEKAAQHDVCLDDSAMISRTAGFGYCAASDITAMLEKRGNLVAKAHPTYAVEIRKLAVMTRHQKSDVRDQGFRTKLASTVDMFDRQTHLNRMYDDGGLERPEEILFQVTEKAADDFLNSHVQMMSGTVYEKTALDALKLDTVREWMGSEFADAVEFGGLHVDADKVATIAQTLPRGDAELFDRMAAESGIAIFARDKAAMDEGLSMPELAGLAQQYNTEAGLRSRSLTL